MQPCIEAPPMVRRQGCSFSAQPVDSPCLGCVLKGNQEGFWKRVLVSAHSLRMVWHCTEKTTIVGVCRRRWLCCIEKYSFSTKVVMVPCHGERVSLRVCECCPCAAVAGTWARQYDRNLVDPASSHTLISKIKPCMSKYKHLYCETANGSLYQL